MLANHHSEDSERFALKGAAAEGAAQVPVDQFLRFDDQWFRHVTEGLLKHAQDEVGVDRRGDASDGELRLGDADWRGVVLQSGEHVVGFFQGLH